jgi:hypothetical protein
MEEDMTVAAAPARTTTQKPAITRDRWHRYTYRGQTYPGVTSILRVLDKSDALMAWASRNTAEAALAQLDHLAGLRDTVGPEGVIKALTARSGWKRDEAAALGTTVHELADLIVRGEPLPRGTSETATAMAEAWAAWWQGAGWRHRLSEAFLVHPDLGYGGTFDLLAYDEHGRTTLADTKTGSVYPEVRLQLTGYGLPGTLVQPQGMTEVWPMPAIERYVVLDTKEDGVRVIDIEITAEDVEAFRACIPLHHWRASNKGRL